MRTLIAVAASLALVAGCRLSKGQPPADGPLGPVATSGAELNNALYQTVGTEMTSGNDVRIVDNGAVFDEIRALIPTARQTIHIVVFIWRPGDPGDSIRDALAKRQPGVACRVIVDPIGSKDFDDEVRPGLEAAGCEVKKFRPTSKTGLLAGRNHRKMVIVDGETGVTGGFGIWKSWLGNGREEEEWRDVAAVVRGPAVEEMQQTFAENWLECGGELLPREQLRKPNPAGKTRAVYVSSKEEAGGTDAYWMTRLMITAAKRRLWIANAYFVPTESFQQLLIKKAQEGVDVRILAPGPVHDVPPVRSAQREVYQELLKHGVRIWEYQPSMLHSKTMVVDEALYAVGSINFDPLSLNVLEEGSLLVEDSELAKRMAAAFEADLAHAVEMTEENRPRPTFLGALYKPLRKLFGRRLTIH